MCTWFWESFLGESGLSLKSAFFAGDLFDFSWSSLQGDGGVALWAIEGFSAHVVFPILSLLVLSEAFFVFNLCCIFGDLKKKNKIFSRYIRLFFIE